MMKLYPSAEGIMIKTCWGDLINHFNSITLYEFVVMPNHFHGTIETTKNDISLGTIFGAFKSITTNRYIQGVRKCNWNSFDYKLWQRNYYEHTIRNEISHQKISDYINQNPEKW